MTEAEWQVCNDPEAMLEHLQGRVSARKLRLLACACTRRVWHLLESEASREAVAVAERYADGRASKRECAEAQLATMPRAGGGNEDAAWACYWTASRNAAQSINAALAYAAGAASDHEAIRQVPQRGREQAAAMDAAFAAERREQARLLREIVGNPYRQIALEPAWFAPEGTVVHLAQALYQERCWEDFPVLADALEEAGCADADILNHCRGQEPHVRGCWLLDLLLTRE